MNKRYNGKSTKYPEADPKDGRPLGAEVMQPAQEDIDIIRVSIKKLRKLLK